MLVDLGAGPVGHTVALVLAQNQNPDPAPDQGDEFGKASPVGLVVILLLGIATIFLIRSMTKHLRRVPGSFDRSGEPDAPATDDDDTSRPADAPRDVEAPPDR